MPILPKDCHPRVIGAEGRKLVHYTFPSKNWEYHEYTGTDHGIDCQLELVENEEFHNKKIEGQIKGTQSVKILKNNLISFSMQKKTLEYGLNSSVAFVLFLVDVTNEIVYYLPIQEYFINNKDQFEKLKNKNETMTVYIPTTNIVPKDDKILQELAKTTYIGDSTKGIKKVEL